MFPTDSGTATDWNTSRFVGSLSGSSFRRLARIFHQSMHLSVYPVSLNGSGIRNLIARDVP